MEATGARLIRYPGKDAEIHNWGVGDVHWANRGCLRSLLERDIARIRDDDYSIWAELGDYADWIAPGDPRFDPLAVDPDVAIADLADLGAVIVDRVAQLFKPIAHKCMALGFGNHEERYFKATHQQKMHDTLCAALESANIMYSGFYVLYFEYAPGLKKMEIVKRPKDRWVNRRGQRRLVVYQHHGFGASSTAGGKINTIKREVDMVDADLYMIGHLHEQIAKSFIQLATDPLGREIKQRPRLGMMSGSYLRGHMSGCVLYSEVKGYHPTTLGASRATFRPEDGRLSVEIAADGAGHVCL